MNRLLVRFALLCVAIILGAIAVAQAQRGIGDRTVEVSKATQILPKTQAPIKVPFQEKPAWAASVDEPQVEGYQENAYASQIPTDPVQQEVRPTAEFAPIAPPSSYEQEPVQQPQSQPTFQQPEFEQPEFEQPALPEYDLAEPEFEQPAEPEFAQREPQTEYQQPEFAQPELAQPEFAQPEFSQPAPAPALAANNFAAEQAYNPPVNPHRTASSAQTYVPPTVEASAVLRQAEPQPEFVQQLPAQESRFAPPPQFVNDQATLRPLQQERLSPGVQGNGKPGTTDLEGPQSPSLTISKTAPNDIQVGKAAEFVITIRNTGSTTAREITVHDEIPAGTELVDTSPPASHGSGGELQWQIGEMQPGDEQTVSMTVEPRQEGEIGSVAKVHFAAAASAKARCTKPQLTVEHSGPRRVLVGEDVVFKIKLHNPGTGIASNVIIEEDVPLGLRHSAGKELEYPVGNLRPGESRLLELTLKADKPGIIDNLVIARADANLEADHQFQLEVIAPLLQVDIDGPRLRFLEREAAFDIEISNPGTANAKNLNLVAHLPRGLKYQSADHQGKYNSQTHTVHWTLAELPANEKGTVRLNAIPSDMGDQKIRVEAKAAMNLSDSAELVVSVDGLAAILFTVKDVNDPIEVGGNTTYEVHVVNQGSKTATNLIVAAQAPNGVQPINGEGPTRGAVSGQRIIFEPLPRLAPQGETTYRINVKASQPGDMRLKFHVASDEIKTPITKEESTHVYTDQ